MKIKTTSKTQGPQSGFALIATMSVMVLLVMIALAMLSLSTIELRSAQQGQAMQEAQANARMALMIALGELQKHAGPDSRVTAEAAILKPDPHASSVKHPHVLGVWQSMGESLSHQDEITAQLYSESYANKERGDRFMRWLISGESASDFDAPKQSSLAASGEGTSILVGQGTLGSVQPQSEWVYAPKVSIRGGAYAWWVGDEGVKARLDFKQPENLDFANKINEGLAASTVGVRKIDALKNLPEGELEKLVSLRSVNLGTKVDTAAGAHFFDVTPHSKSLLTNTLFGGPMKDLSLMSELDALPSDLTGVEIAEGLVDWREVYEYCRSYKPYNEGGYIRWQGSQPILRLGENYDAIIGGKYGWFRLMPVISKFQFLISHYSVPVTSTEYEVKMAFDKIIELWNPYTLPFEMPEDAHFHMKLWNLPFGTSYRVNDQLWTGSIWNDEIRSRGLIWTALRGGDRKATMKLNQRPLAAGEVRMYSDGENLIDRDSQHQRYEPVEGWEYGGGMQTSDIGHFAYTLRVPANARIEPQLEVYPWSAPYGRHHFVDTWLQADNGYRYYGEISTRNSFDTTAQGIGKGEEHDFSVGSVIGAANKKPFALIGMRLRTERSTDDSADGNREMVTQSQQTKLKHHLFGGVNRRFSTVEYDDALQMAYNPYEYFVKPLHSLDDAMNHISVTADNKGFYGTSNSSQEPNIGQNYVAVKELPFQPVLSIAQLQHAPIGEVSRLVGSGVDVGVYNGYHPHVDNAFGNSYATPFIASGSVQQAGKSPQNRSQTTLYDKSWLANQYLWDGYFFSGVADQMNPFYSSPRNQQQVLEDALTFSTPLPNQRYRFSEKRTESDARSLTEELLEPDGYHKLASYLTREGSFNVNSVSVKAWKAFLASLDQQTLMYLEAETGDLRERFDGAGGYDGKLSVSRFALPIGDVASSGDQQRREFLNKRWRGARAITDEDLDDLADAIVEQVHLRGPFLSLGEFVNRRLSTGEMGEKGALQAAIDETEINESFQTTSEKIVSNPGVILKNSKAAEGLTGVGAPGYVTQADLLMPLAPHVTVRSDTFRVRSYGESVDAQGKVRARAWCEAIVQRSPDYIDPRDGNDTIIVGADGSVDSGALTSVVNQTFGRRLQVVHLRWLSSEEV